MLSSKVFSIAPFEYIHVLNKNDNTKRLVCGPQNFALEDHEEIAKATDKMLIIPNLHYIKVQNPVERDNNGEIVKDRFGLIKYRWNKIEVRTREAYPRPFALYPEEKLFTSATALDYINTGEALHLRCTISFTDKDRQRVPGEEWYFIGPEYYIPIQEVDVVRKVKQEVIEQCQALRLKATKNLTDFYGKSRKAGEEWLIREVGAYLPQVGEKVIGIEYGHVLDDRTAVHLRALSDYVDFYGIKRKAGEEWLITSKTAGVHICDVYEKRIELLNLIVMSEDEYCVILNPYLPETRSNQLGKERLVCGPESFFLNPGESLKDGKVQKVQILTAGESLLLQAKEDYIDSSTNTLYKAGTKWMINGPIRFTPPVEVRIISVSSIIPLDKNEGIYVRNIKSGKVFKHMGSSYSLKPDEILWEKELPLNVEQIYLRDSNLTKRDKTRIVAYKCPFNAIIQIYNMKEKTSRIVFGPDLAVLDPDEEFTLMSLSGKTPKIANQIKTLYLNLGPVFSSDQFDVETVDHTRLKLKVAYLWQFNISRGEDAEALKIFTMTDFIGDMCLNMASKIRSFVATITFEDFHKNSDRLIKRAVFGENEIGEINSQICYEDCRLVINDVDIQSVIPTDPTTQNLLSQSVSLAIELATKTIEQEYVIASLIKEQEFKGEVEKLKITNEIDYLKKLQDLSKLKIESKIIETTGLSRAHALAVKEASVIESRSKVKLAEMTKIASDIETEFEIQKKKKQNENEYLKVSEDQRLEIKRQVDTDQVEATRFKEIIEALGPSTLVEIARAGPELKAKLLSGLNLNGYIVTDGNNPINLFNVANNMIKTD